MSEEMPQFGPWEAIEKLGEGGMCAVWRVRHQDDPSQERAVKVLLDRSPQAPDRFAHEARLLISLDHPTLLSVESIEADERPPWLVMELLAGRDLEEEREEGGAFEPERAARIIADVARGLALVHESGIRHRDIKPSNIMVAQDGIPRLIDFGIAREVEAHHLTQQGMLVGTLTYLPPEVFEVEDARAAQDSESADVFALGQTLCELLSGEPVYAREGSQTKQMGWILRDKIERDFLDPREWHSKVPEDLARVVIDATRRDPARRIASAAELESRLRDWLADRRSMDSAPISHLDPSQLPAPPGTSSGRPASAARPSTSPLPAPKRRKAGLWGGMLGAFLMAGLLLVTLAGVLALYLYRPTSPSPGAVATAAQHHLEQQSSHLAECGLLIADETRADAQMDLVFAVRGGRAEQVRVRNGGEGNRRLESCVVEAISAMRFDHLQGGAIVELPVRWRR